MEPASGSGQLMLQQHPTAAVMLHQLAAFHSALQYLALDFVFCAVCHVTRGHVQMPSMCTSIALLHMFIQQMVLLTETLQPFIAEKAPQTEGASKTHSQQAMPAANSSRVLNDNRIALLVLATSSCSELVEGHDINGLDVV
jgi:hypothetical protein